MTLKKRIYLLGAVDFLTVILMVSARFFELKSNYINGFALGLFVSTMPFLIYLIIKSQNKEFKEDYELTGKDERIRQNIHRARSLGFLIQSIILIAVAVLSYIFDFKMYYPVIGTILATMIFTKVYIVKMNRTNTAE